MMVVFTCGTPDLSVSVCVFYVARSHPGGRGAVENARRRGWAGQYRSDGPGWGAPGDDGVAQGAIAVDEITLRNYRCFRDEQIARLAPLTLLVGENSTGKTSFMAMIRALWDAAYRSRVPNFKEEPYDLGSFDEIAHHRGARGGRAEEIHSGFSASPRAPRRKGKSTTADGTPARFAVTFHRKGTTPIPRTRRLQGNGTWIEIRDEEPRFSFGTPGGAWSLTSPESLRRELDAEDDPTLDPFFFASDTFRHGKNWSDKAVPVSLQGSSSPTNDDLELVEQLAEQHPYLGFQARRPYASAPVRSKPRRTYDPARPTRDPEGDYVPMYLANQYFRNERKWAALKNRLEGFGRDADLFDEISIKPLGKRDSEPFQVQVRKFAGGLKGPQRNLIDVGYGVSQVLPVITELLRDDASPMFLLQQPEVHLHPRAQAALGSLFCRIAGPERQLVVETHSDHLLDRVRMDIRDERTPLKPEDVSILFFERGALDVHIHSLRLDRMGNVLDAPDSYRRFFMEETTRSLGL